MCEKVCKIKGLVIVNKKIGLPIRYNPGLDKRVISSFKKMKECALKDGVNLNIISGFRTYEEQEEVYNEYIKEFGEEKTNTFSAKPGHSEHQTGLAIDICDDSDNFIGTKQDIWLQKNAYKFGYIIRYPKGKEEITGYKYEPWHLRYVGKCVAKYIHKRGITLEEYLKII